MRTSERLDDVSTADDMAPLLKKRRIDEQELAREESMEEQLEEDPAEEMANQQEQHRRQEWLKLSKEKRTALRRLHNMIGHCSTRFYDKDAEGICGRPGCDQCCETLQVSSLPGNGKGARAGSNKAATGILHATLQL